MNSTIDNTEFPYQDLITNTCVISFVLGEDSEILQANDRFYEVLKIDRDNGHPEHLDVYMKTKSVWNRLLKALDNKTFTTTQTLKLYQIDGHPIFLKSNLGKKDGKIYVVSIDVTVEVLTDSFVHEVNEMAKLGGWAYNPDLDKALWTPTIYSILEIPTDIEVNKDTLLDYVHPDSLEQYQAAVDFFYSEKERYDITIKVYTHDKSRVKWVRVTATPDIRKGKVVFVYGTLQDITELKEQSIALEETQINMELALRAMNSGYFTHDLVANDIVYSSSFRDKMNLPLVLSDKEFLDYIHPEDRDEAVVQHYRELDTDSAYYINAYRFKSYETNEYKHFEVYGFKVFDNKGTPKKLVGNLIDVEDKYRLNQMTDKHRYYIKTLLDNAFVRSIMLDKNWNLLGMDASTTSIFLDRLGYNPVLKGDNFKQLLSPHDKLKFQIIERVMNEGREYRNEVYLEIFENNRVFYDALFKPILNYSNQVDGYVFYFFDLTDQALIKEELQSYQNKLKTVHHFKNNIITKLGNEIKAPLHGLLQSTEMIFQDEKLNSQEGKLLKAQQESAKRLLRSFDTIINSTLYENDFYIIKDKIDLNLILFQIFKGAVKRASARGLEFTFNNFSDEVTILGDSVFLKQSLENLLDNAFKFTDAGEISVTTAIKDNYAEITLTDTGIGIPSEQLKEIFKPSQPASDGEARHFDGLGLTFAIKYIEGIGGYLHVESELNTGTTFIVALPLLKS